MNQSLHFYVDIPLDCASVCSSASRSTSLVECCLSTVPVSVASISWMNAAKSVLLCLYSSRRAARSLAESMLISMRCSSADWRARPSEVEAADDNRERDAVRVWVRTRVDSSDVYCVCIACMSVTDRGAAVLFHSPALCC